MAAVTPHTRIESAVLKAILAFAIFLQAAPATAQNHVLKFDKEIGVGWRAGKYGWMSFVSFSPDGTMVVSDGPSTPDDISGNLTLWNFADGQFIKQLPARPSDISRDWKFYATDHEVAEMETGKPLISLGKDVFVKAFSPDSRYVVESIQRRGHGPHIRIVELATGKQISGFGQHAPFAIAVSPDDATLASGHWDVVTLWDMFTGQRLAVFPGFGRYVDGLSFSPDGTLLAAATDAGGLQIWDVHNHSRLQSLDIEGSYVSEPAFSPDGRLVAVGVYGTGTVWLIDISRGKIIDHQKVSDLGCGSVAFSPDGRYLITPSTGGLVKWPYDKGGTIRVFRVAP